ncbi:MAG: SDR family NAD(P)-dependent oxidoreductase [Gammaproteobacteria bacterium]|nr:SDR family NAD(P)-dependent oxidoreductase [Gammaproteobacteria bacterium]
MKISSLTALVTGGASGMGEATARHLATCGAKVIILDQNIERSKQVAAEIGGMAISCDVTDEKNVQEAIEAGTKQFGVPRICVNCAGIVQAKRMAGREGPLPLADFEKVIRINLIGTFNVMRVAAFAMTKSDPIDQTNARGVIINTASVAAFEGQIGQVAYSASKGGVVGMTLPAARELAQFGIRVMTIAPGLVDTPMFAALPNAARNKLAEAVPFPKRLAHATEFAQLVQYIIENDMLNGSVIRLDGALRMQ